MNEESTKYHLINPVLATKGYDDPWKIRLETPPPVEPTGFKGRRGKSNGRTDYLIYVRHASLPKPWPVGVLEAKPEDVQPMSGMQQAKGYAACARHAVQYVFATNGHRYGEFDAGTGQHTGPLPLAEFPSHAALSTRYALDKGLDIASPAAALLFQADSPAYNRPRYYQDAAIRAAFSKVLQCEQAGQPARVLLSLATGAGKTIIAANLLWRLHEAGRLGKPALFLCDRDELRAQALDKIGRAFPAGSVRVVQTENGHNAARNAKVHIATYQALGLDDEDTGAQSFLSRHYPDDAFSVIVIDECHRSAWGRWSEVLRRNPGALHIGLTATPRQLREAGRGNADDASITANNLAYFGEPVYEYTLIEAQEDGYLSACEIVQLKASVDGGSYTREQVLAQGVLDARTGRYLSADELKNRYAAESFDRDLLMPRRINAMCDDLFKRLCAHGGPEQKVIIFCTRDAHADRVAQRLQNNYADWCRAKDRTPKDHYAFKCTDQAGADLLPSLRGSSERCFIACTVDLLATGVDIERLNAVVFFRYLSSSILFYQMVGRGTRIDEPTHKYKFWLYDYTGVTALFGTDFLTAAPAPRKAKADEGEGGEDEGGDDEGGGDDDDAPPLPELVGGQPVLILPQGRFILQRVQGRDVRTPVDEYRQAMVARVLTEAATLHDFRGLWVEAEKRRALIDHLLGEHYSPDTVRDLMDMVAFDHFDLFAHYGYRERALTRPEREAAYLGAHAPWFDAQPADTAIVLRGLGHQFGHGGTDALESPRLWDVPEIRRAGGLHALRRLGRPVDVIKDAKMRLFEV